MKKIDIGGINYIELVPDGTSEWYYGLSRELTDMYEAEECHDAGETVRGNTLCLIHYPDGEVFRPVPKKDGTYIESPVFLDQVIYILTVDFPAQKIRIFAFDCASHETALHMEKPLESVINCYNLRLHTAPLTLARQGDDDVFEIIWPDRTGFPMDPHESFFMRDGEKLYFSRWNEKGEGDAYRYWEDTVIRDLSGKLLEVLPGDFRVMPDGELWHIL